MLSKLIFCRLTSRQYQRHRFSLIELLVVSAMFAVLVSLLSPALNNAMVQTRKASCSMNQSNTIKGMSLFAEDNDGKFPEGSIGYTDERSGSVAMSSIWCQANKKTGTKGNYYDGWRGPGILHYAGYIDGSKSLYCPSYKYPSENGGIWIDNIFDNGFGYFKGGIPTDHPKDPLKTNNKFWEIYSSYEYRQTIFSGDKERTRVAQMGVDSGSTPILADGFSDLRIDSKYNVWAFHELGYNIGRLDGSVKFIEDYAFQIKLILIENRDYGYVATREGKTGSFASLQEKVWEIVFNQ